MTKRTYMTLRVVLHLLLVASLIGEYLTSLPSSGDYDTVGGFIIAALLIWGLLAGVKFLYRDSLRVKFWQRLKELSDASPGGVDQGHAKGGPVITGGLTASARTDPVAIRTAQGSEITITQVTFGDNLIPWGNLSQTAYSLSYIVASVPIAAVVPHIFIDGRSQNRFDRHSHDLWSIVARLSKNEKLQDLEGDFYKYFDVYAVNKDAISSLQVLTPDVMWRLRRAGKSFDYEMYDGMLYVVRDFQANGAKEADEFIAAITSCLEELIPQLVKGSYTQLGQLHVRRYPVRLQAFGYMLGVVGWGLVKATVYILVAFVVGFGLQQIVRMTQ